VRREEADTVVVGSGIAGVLVARELARRGMETTIVERGSFLPWREQLRLDRWEGSSPTSVHNHETDPRGLDWGWDYVYGVGGSMNRWTGIAPRLLPEDFEVKSRFGVARDWPLSYDDLAPYYRKAEALLSVAGQANGLMPGADYPLPPHPLSPQDRALEPHLEPFIRLPQARPTRPVRGRPACCGSARCMLCPVDARFSVLNGLGRVLDDPRVRIIDRTVAVRLRPASSHRRIATLECTDARGGSVTLHASRFVLAANGIENPALLLRSEIDEGDTGRYITDHVDAELAVRTSKPVSPGHGSSLETGASYAYYTGGFRSRRAALLLVPSNPGQPIPRDAIVDRLAAGQTGQRMRRRVVAEWERTLSISVQCDDLPDRRNAVTLSSRRDRFGIPLNRIHFAGPTDYQRRAVHHLVEDLPRRLRTLRARDVKLSYPQASGHLIGSVRMGLDDGAVLDPDLRHRRYENLFVAGSAVFPTIAATPPSLTIAALAVRLGRFIAGGSA